MMYKKCEEKAVTVVALAITIIVLLIIVGVTLNLAIGNNGILKSAEESSNTYANRTKEEISMMQEIETTVEDKTGEDTTLIGMYKSGRIKIGDYLNYEIPKEGEFISSKNGNETSNGFDSQKYNVNNNGHNINWRVLGLEDNDGRLTTNISEGKHLLLISGSPVKKEINNESEKDYNKDPYLYMGKAESFVNGERILNGISSIYVNGKYAERGRSISAEDINKILGIEIADGKVFEKQDTNKNNIDELRNLGNTYTYCEDDYSATSFLNNKKTAIENGEDKIVGTGYIYGVEKYKEINIGSTTIGELLFNDASFDNNNSKSYWLASKGITINKKVIFSLGMMSYDKIITGNENFNSKGDWNVQGFCVRPIITLKSDTTIEDLHVIDCEEEKWNYNNNKMYSGNKDNYDSGELLGLFY